MARSHLRSPSPDSSAKRLKTSHEASNGTNASSSTHGTGAASLKFGDPTSQFMDGLFDHHTTAKLHASYVANQPFKYTVVEKLFQDELLKKVKDECLSELNFTEKETDIYKVNQTGDLASLNYLTEAQISLLPSLLTLRDALYSAKFRSWLQAVTGCGPLSGKKQDMSVNSYTKGCHLLNHDDVIGTRRVSYILYMPLPHYTFWQKDWGGALELYPAKMGEDGHMEPEVIPSKSIPPSWNQFIFFEVQPGRSFHSVEEVVVGGEGEDGRERLSISGWFHAAQEGEEGYMPETAPAAPVKSSREQLTSTQTVFKPYPETSDPPHPDTVLAEEHIGFLSEFLNPVYLQPRTMETLSTRFAQESSLELHSFLSNSLAESLLPRLRELDTRDGLGEDRAGRIPPHTAGTQRGWSVKGPPHKWRYCVLDPHGAGAPAEAVTPRAAHASSDAIMRSLQDELFPSAAFRAWLACVSRLLPLSYAVEARRFRPGLDYTLATSEEKEVRLDVVLGLTPGVKEQGKGEGSSCGSALASALDDVRGWQAAEWGGWECYMAPHDEEDDPAVYRSGSRGKSATNGSASKGQTSSSSGKAPASSPSANGDDEMADAEDDEEDGTLLTVQPGFNRLLLVLRDERVMRFVKYVSAAAEGSRWDVCGEYEVGMVAEDDES
ncbi:putative oxoglutarate and iron-dependent oxygenase degradation C-term [Lyophyllum shimeji]|uniref:uS12 prolyl 3,4-dihydroxylase n=1 Tax=Lyophyllum shimeji TaxID=47721 RepID=A0A9P3PDL8_LYOSH|nr:putative oxoglutarate and iron-dependent oxygenase degradation C-term [Lyophyllum shimeji]